MPTNKTEQDASGAGACRLDRPVRRPRVQTLVRETHEFQRRAFETLDCRTCRHFRGTAHCHSVLRCVAGSSYQKTAPIQLWEEAPLADPGF